MIDLRRGVAALALFSVLASPAWAAQVATAPPLDALKSQLDAWLAPQLTARPELKQEVDNLWSTADKSLDASQRSDLLLRTFYLADSDVRELIESCTVGSPGLTQRDFPALSSRHDEPLFTNNVRREFYGRFLATATLYEEALDVYRQIDIKHVADPATVLFYKAVCEHALGIRLARLAVSRAGRRHAQRPGLRLRAPFSSSALRSAALGVLIWRASASHWRISAARPPTIGADIDVPLS